MTPTRKKAIKDYAIKVGTLLAIGSLLIGTATVIFKGHGVVNRIAEKRAQAEVQKHRWQEITKAHPTIRGKYATPKQMQKISDQLTEIRLNQKVNEKLRNEWLRRRRIRGTARRVNP